MAGTKTLLLDVDGVLVRDRRLLEHVHTNCVNYVRAKLPDAKDSHVTNNLLYLVHGHTARGLEKAFGVDTSDFNKSIYTKKLLSHLAEVLTTETFQKEAAEINNLSREGWNISLFTNAPWIWAVKVATAIGDDVAIRCAGNPHESPLKPEAAAYMFHTEGPTVFVDDSLKNLGTARYLENWRCIHFTEGPFDKNVWCPQVGTISDLVKNLVDTLE